MNITDHRKASRPVGDKGDSSPALLRRAFSELEAQNEELLVVEEELHTQNEALEAAALALDGERQRYRDLFHAAPEPSLLTDLLGVIHEANPAAYALLGVGQRYLKGKPLAIYVGPDSRRAFRTEFLGQVGMSERGVYLQPKSGGLLYATLRVSPVCDSAGSPVGLRWLVRGATPDPGGELARYRQIMAEVRDFAVFTQDAQGRVTGWNAGAEIIFGWAAAEVIGRPSDLIFTPEDRRDGVPQQERARAGEAGRTEDERWHLRKDGSRLWASGVMTALSDGAGGPPWYARIVRDLTERKVAEEERDRQKEALRLTALSLASAHAQTVEILESISDAFYTVDADFCFTYVNRRAEAWWGRPREDLIGNHYGTEFPAAVGSHPYQKHLEVMADRRPAHFEAVSALIGGWVEVSIHPTDGGGLSVYFRDISARKALEAERERLAERERNIAAQLQAALTPAVPERVPGMALSKHYRAALAEAGVGGDFYDVFLLRERGTALVVGDVSGKGLAAASQVATVRNMLRSALYHTRSLADALEGLNSLLIEQALLTAFATLFIGVFDSITGGLTYVNCGQEPALVRRASGTIEELPPTGPVLGSFRGVPFGEQTVALGSGDALAVFTDGLTDVGRSRQAMLGSAGVAELLRHSVIPQGGGSAEAAAKCLTLALISAVDAAAQGGVVDDDIALLIGVVE